jgi:hypothetical protein
MAVRPFAPGEITALTAARDPAGNPHLAAQVATEEPGVFVLGRLICESPAGDATRLRFEPDPDLALDWRDRVGRAGAPMPAAHLLKRDA